MRPVSADVPEDQCEDRENDDRDDKCDSQRHAVASVIRYCVAKNGKDHSRSSLPVRCRKTECKLGASTCTSSTRKPTSWMRVSSGGNSVATSCTLHSIRLFTTMSPSSP